MRRGSPASQVWSSRGPPQCAIIDPSPIGAALGLPPYADVGYGALGSVCQRALHAALQARWPCAERAVQPLLAASDGGGGAEAAAGPQLALPLPL